MNMWVYEFGDGRADGDAGLRNLLGGKGANLAEMSRLGLPVPPGFTITTEVCTAVTAGGSYPESLREQVAAALTTLEARMQRRFGDPEAPLLISVRSGARASMPGMMDTVLNLGLNDETVAGLAAGGGERFAWDSYRRFIQMYGNVVLGLPHDLFEEALEIHKESRGLILDTELGADDWRTLVGIYKQQVAEETGRPFPADPEAQLWGAIDAVFGSWCNPRAIAYRRLHDIPESWGTAVNVQAMVFGNMGEDCCTGVAFTRDPSTGANAVFGEYLVNAQGEDVVAGIRTPNPITRAARHATRARVPAMEEADPSLFAELSATLKRLELHYRDMQDVEFTVERGRLFMLQTRTGKRSAAAAVKIAVDMVAEGLIDRSEAIRRVSPDSLDQLLHPTLDPKAPRTLLTRGLPASPGSASGAVVFNAATAADRAAAGQKVILVRTETSPEDIHGMHAALAILTARGGTTSHAALVARGMGRPCVAGAGELRIDEKAGQMRVGDTMIRDGEAITVDGSTGEVFAGAIPTVLPELSGDFSTLMGWADEVRTMAVRANAETPADARIAREFGAEGIGLCRTEHMFFEADRIVAVREMILAADETGRRTALARIAPVQKADFVGLFREMDGLPVTIRLLDPPLHEFLPNSDAEMAQIAEATGLSLDAVKRRAAGLVEINPMLGHRGCRLGITYPEIYEMQARAIFEAAAEARAGGIVVLPEIMIPLVATRVELDRMKAVVDTAAAEVAAATGGAIPYAVGTMIELPRAALRAGDIAGSAAFFSFGTNDLTQTALGISRDDAAGFIGAYEAQGIYPKNPFVTIDVQGVGELVQMAAERGRKVRPDLKLGICGEHGGDPASIAFCQQVGLDYVSCSPYRVPIARLAAAHAALDQGARTRPAEVLAEASAASA
ncbi:MAG: pyruvate, phosphate dikinase [Alphaproteobacteria bacterium]